MKSFLNALSLQGYTLWDDNIQRLRPYGLTRASVIQGYYITL
ncbi:MAG: hypothetical protein ACSW77_06040 [Bacteroidales bacterium]